MYNNYKENKRNGKMLVALFLIFILVVSSSNISVITASNNPETKKVCVADGEFIAPDSYYIVLSSDSTVLSLDIDLHKVLISKIPYVLPKGSRCIVYHVVVYGYKIVQSKPLVIYSRMK